MSDVITSAAISGLASLGVAGMSGGRHRDHERMIERENIQRNWAKAMSDLSHTRSIELATLGNEMDIANQKEMFDYRINQGKAAGLTPFEMFLGPAGGAGGGTNGTGATLGNQPGVTTAAQIQAGQQAFNARTQMEIARLNNETSLKQSAIQASAQLGTAAIQSSATKYSAGMSADASQYQAELKYKIDHKRLVLDRERFEKVDLPQAAANIKKTEQETKELINRVATSDPEFMIMMKRLQMGPQNVLVEYAINNYGFNPLDKESVSRASAEMKRNFLGLVLGSQSVAVRELFGTSLASGMAVGQGLETLGNVYTGYMNKWGFDPQGYVK